MLNICRICFTSPILTRNQLPFCVSCSNELAELRLYNSNCKLTFVAAPNSEIQSLWRYRGVIRELILRAKVKRDCAALRHLVSLVESCDEVQSLVNWSDVIIPAPSSLWGRVHGSLDIASQVAHQLSKKTGKTISTAPSDLYWRWRKQARRGRESRVDEDLIEMSILKLRRSFLKWFGSNNGSVPSFPNRVLLIDDVVTSGATLSKTARALKDRGAGVVRCLTIARSYT